MQGSKKKLICFSHLRWDFVFQRPQHLISRFSHIYKVYYIEEPIFISSSEGYLSFSKRKSITVIVPHIPLDIYETKINIELEKLLNNFFAPYNLQESIFWYYTPMALSFTQKFRPALIIYDCMDELSAFKFAPESLREQEKKLFTKANLVFTGGYSLYEAKKSQHDNIWPYPSSIEKQHFLKARDEVQQPIDQAKIRGIKLGFYGVIDERFDLLLVKKLAIEKPDWQIILIGPIVKIDPNTLPVSPNIHYLGQKEYQTLPQYLSGWDIALIPFALNESTRFISPTKTLEYLAAGKPVISTPISDIVTPYGTQELVHIAYDYQDFIRKIEKELANQNKSIWLEKVDKFLKNLSWDITYNSMNEKIKWTMSNSLNEISKAS